MESELETEQNCNILTPTLMAVSVVSFLFSRAAQLEGRGPTMLPFSTTSCHQRVSETTGGPEGPFGREWLSLPHLISNSARLQLSLHVLTELYYSSTPTQSPTQSLEWHVWLSSSGNNCQVVQRSLSFVPSFYECIMAITLSHSISQISPHDLFRLLAIGMCHFLLMRHFGMACWPGPKVNIQQAEVVVSALILSFFDPTVT